MGCGCLSGEPGSDGKYDRPPPPRGTSGFIGRFDMHRSEAVNNKNTKGGSGKRASRKERCNLSLIRNKQVEV